jgi:hypothetical protein
LTDSEEFAILCRKPFNLTLEQYLQLDDWQIVNVYFRPPTPESAKRGYYWPAPPAMHDEDLLGYKQTYYELAKESGWELEKIKKGWRRYRNVLLSGNEGQRVPGGVALERARIGAGIDAKEARKEREQYEKEMIEARKRRKPRGHY